MTTKQQKAMLNLSAIYAQFGVIFVSNDSACAYFQAAKTAPLEQRHIETMARSFKQATGLKFMLKPVDNFNLN